MSDENVSDGELIQGVLDSVHDVYKLRGDNQLRVSFRMNSVEYVLPLDEDVGSPIFKAIQAILRSRRPWLILKYGKFIDMNRGCDA